MLKLGKGSKITSNHYLDLCGDIILEEYALLAGRGTQVWTHYYGNFESSRFRIDADVVIGSYTYIGSRSVLQAPLNITNHVTVASGCNMTGNYSDPQRLIVPSKNRTIELQDAVQKLDRFDYEHKDEIEPCLKKTPK